MSDRLDRVIKTAVRFAKDPKANDSAIVKAVQKANLRKGEPVFVLRGNDCVAWKTIAAWLNYAEQAGSPAETLNKVRKKLQEFENYRDDLSHSLDVKVPT